MPASPPAMTAGSAAAAADPGPDPTERLDALLVELDSSTEGLSSREATRRLAQHGPNALRRQRVPGWPAQLAAQFTHPLALLLLVAGGLAFAGQLPALGVAIFAVVVLNPVVAFVQERHAERAVEALERYLPAKARILRDGREQVIDARELVPGDIMMLDEGDRVCADGRLIEGSLEMDLSTLTGESVTVVRARARGPWRAAARGPRPRVQRLERHGR